MKKLAAHFVKAKNYGTQFRSKHQEQCTLQWAMNIKKDVKKTLKQKKQKVQEAKRSEKYKKNDST